MKAAGARQQTLFLTGVNALVRALGLLLRMILSRILGAEIMGIAELAQSVHMIAITPLTSGLPLAVSRLTALSSVKARQKPLMAALRLARYASVCLIPVLLLFSSFIARLMGDVRVLPSLWFTAPCVLILGYSAAYNGYCYGVSRSELPAISELIEQAGRLAFTLLFLQGLKHLTAPWLAAVPVAATMAAELVGLWFVIHSLHLKDCDTSITANTQRKVFNLAWPTTVSRLIQTLLRSLTAILIPLRLQASGLSAAEATARLGMLNGMVMPLMMLPCVFTSALSMVALPRIAQAETNPKELKRLLGICTGGCVPVASLCAAALYVCAPVFSNVLYRLPELTPLFRLCAPMTVLFACVHLTSSILSSLGQQTASMIGSSAVSVVTLVLTWLWTADPNLRLTGVVWAQSVGQILSLAFNSIIFVCWNRKRNQTVFL